MRRRRPTRGARLEAGHQQVVQPGGGRINEIVLGKRSITADTDLRLTRYLGLTPGFFLGLQADYDLMARRREIGDEIEAINPRAA